MGLRARPRFHFCCIAQESAAADPVTHILVILSCLTSEEATKSVIRWASGWTSSLGSRGLVER